MMNGMEAALRVSPLTVLVRSVLERALPEAVISEMARAHGPATYTRKLTLQTCVSLMLETVIGAAASIHRATRGLAEPLQVSLQALYEKLGRTPPELSCQFVTHSAQALLPLTRSLESRVALPGYRLKFLDGTMPDASEHRLKVLRRPLAPGLPANFCVVLDDQSGLCERVVASEDAYTHEQKLCEQLLPHVQEHELYLADRGYCGSWLMDALNCKKACFVIREHVLSMIARSHELRRGSDETGDYFEQGISIRQPRTKTILEFRRVILRLRQPLDDGTNELRWVTNLPAQVTAQQIAHLYRLRWTIEHCFQRLKTELQGELPSLGQPRAAILTLCMAMVAFNALALVKLLATRSKQGLPAEQLSGYHLTQELGHSYDAIDRLTKPHDWLRITRLSTPHFLKHCRELANLIPWYNYRSNPRGPKKPTPKTDPKQQRQHQSTYRLLNPP
jgi:hypothetical protein